MGMHVLEGVTSFYTHYLFHGTGLSLVLVLGWVYVIYGAVTGKREAVYHCLVGLLLTPLVVFLGHSHLRTGQGLIIFLESFVVASFALVAIGRRFAVTGGSGVWDRYISQLLWGTGLALVVTTQLAVGIGGPAGAQYATNSAAIHELAGVQRESFEETAQGQMYAWLERQTTEDSAVMFTEAGLARLAYFQFGGTRDIHYTPIAYVPLREGTIWCYVPCHTPNRFPPGAASTLKDDRSVFVGASATSVDQVVGSKLLIYAAPEKLLLSQIKKHGTDYVVVHRTSYAEIAQYFKTNPGFVKVRNFDGFLVFAVVDPVPVDEVSPIVSSDARVLAQTLHRDNSRLYQQYKTVLNETIGLNRSRIVRLSEE